MPIPKPNPKEKQDDFVSRCVPALYPKEYGQREALAICITTYEKSKMDLSSAERVAIKMKGISLLADLEKGEDDPCWDGYVQVGTKDVDGKTVPNCVPMDAEMEKIQMEKGIDLADYPWDECIADMTARYESEETAKKVCGMIKSKYGGE